MRKLATLSLGILTAGLIAGTALAAGPEESWSIKSATAAGNKVTVTVDPGQLKIVAPGEVKPGEGHWHWYLDGKELGKGPKNEIVFENVAPGQHTIKIELHDGSHKLINARETTVTVALPRTGGSVGLLLAAGAAALGAGAYLQRRCRR